MLISMNWISDFVDLNGVDIKELINRFTLSTAEVEDVYEYGKDISNVVAAKILEVNEHPTSQKLHILSVDDGEKTVQVVCGAPNVCAGMVVPFAREGGVVQGQKIAACAVAGVQSYGMCCSEKELGISDNHGGLMELDHDVKLGTCVKELFPIEDIVFEVDNKSLTNRPDLWGHYGIAREIAVLSNRKLKPILQAEIDCYDNLPAIDISVEDSEKCLRYSGVVIKNITKKISPVKMQIRLNYCGMRSLNLLADLTNYLMLELGQPMHAFDNALVNKIRVKTFVEPIDFETLDNEKRKIPSDTLMICSADEPVAIAGIMGGAGSAISDDTTAILLESATFDGVAVRKASIALSHRTEASARYEKVLDPELTIIAIRRFIKLLKDIDDGAEVDSSVTDKYVRHYDDVRLTINKVYIDKYTGIEIDNQTILNTLTALGFGVILKDDIFDVSVPSFRATKDVSIKADLIEEITRIYGYDNFDIKTNSTPLIPVRHSVEREDEYNAKLFLAHQLSLNEVHSYLWYNYKTNRELCIEVPDNVKIMNSVSPDTNMLREYIAPTLLGFAQVNKNNFSDIGIFEIGKVVKGVDKDKMCDERKTLGILVGSKTSTEKDTFYKVKTAINALMSSLKNSTPTYESIGDYESLSWVHPYNSQAVTFDGVKLGYITSLHPTVKNNLDKKMNIALAELDFAVIAALVEKPIEFSELSRFPGVEIDLSLMVDKSVPYSVIDKNLAEFKNEFLQKHELIDIYDDATPDKKSVTVRFYFCSMEKTLSGDDVDCATKAVLTALEKINVTLR